MSILGPCNSLNLNYSGCCKNYITQKCHINNCHCDKGCYSNNDCCSDIADIGCYPNSTEGKTKLDDHAIHKSQFNNL